MEYSYDSQLNITVNFNICVCICFFFKAEVASICFTFILFSVSRWRDTRKSILVNRSRFSSFGKMRTSSSIWVMAIWLDMPSALCSVLEFEGRSSIGKWRSCRKVLCWGKSPILPIRRPHWVRQRCVITFGGPGCLLPLLYNLQDHQNIQKLLIAISIPQGELLFLVGLLTAFIKDLPLT